MKITEMLKKKKFDIGKAQPPRRPSNLPLRPVPGTFGRAPSAGSVLSERIGNLTKQGMSEPEIVKELRVEGFSSLEIDKALRDSLKGGVGEPVLPVMERGVRETRTPSRFEEDVEKSPFRLNEPPIPPRPVYGDRPQQAKPFPVIDLRKPSMPSRTTEELIEVTVSEKLKNTESEMKGFEGKLADLDNRLKRLEDDVEFLKVEEQRKESEFSKKIDGYKDSMGEISARMGGMESALKSALESVLESNRTLSEAVRGLKDKR